SAAPAWTARLLAAAGVLLVPWVVLLVIVLPTKHESAHWDIAWAGFDVVLAVLLLAVALTAWRRSPWLGSAASAAGAPLLVGGGVVRRADRLERNRAVDRGRRGAAARAAAGASLPPARARRRASARAKLASASRADGASSANRERPGFGSSRPLERASRPVQP